ncbi:C40 family peptidase [Indiicoccus explosivorum]|uniref:C40 family peptidase n=1 Tax=Indiicoccus explosivorum TaxID=1917864 RepID=UPI00138FB26D|nr:LysM peptidoglycan-binding domain-containing C40 family peptidase [Indiicoccus explosivorum]
MRKTKKALLAFTATVALSSAAAAPASAATHQVSYGDTLWEIAQTYGTTVNSLQAINGISSHLIYAGQTIETSGAATAAAPQVKSQFTTNAYSAVADVAKRYVGVPYVWGGSTPAGFDCSGFIYHSLNQAGHNVSRTNAQGYYNMADKVSNPQPGDLVFFSGTYKAGISHIGIYIGGGKMVSANGGGVGIDSVYGPYWGDHFAGYGRM